MNFLTDYKLQTKSILLIAIMCFFYFYRVPGEYLNEQTEKLFYSLEGEEAADTSIVLIHISEDDIQQFGNWPLKRSYYALIIKELSKLNVKKIGLEIFLSDNVTQQPIYNNLLKEQILNSGNVILSSLYTNQENSRDTLIYPWIKKNNEGIQTGHLSFVDSSGLYIPLWMELNGMKELSFSLALTEDANNYLNQKYIKINFHSSWAKFRNYTLLQFFKLVENDSPELSLFKNKIIVVGVSDPKISKTISTYFDHDLPGLAIHAFALDNLLQERFINTNYYRVSSFLIVILIAVLILFENKLKKTLKYFLFAGFLILSFILFIFFQIELNYSLFLIPAVILFSLDVLFYFAEKRKYLSDIVNEADSLKKTLELKEVQLSGLYKELDISGEDSQNKVSEKIASLKSDIEKLKIQQEDKTPVIPDSDTEKEKNFFGIVYQSKTIRECN